MALDRIDKRIINLQGCKETSWSTVIKQKTTLQNLFKKMYDLAKFLKVEVVDLPRVFPGNV